MRLRELNDTLLKRFPSLTISLPETRDNGILALNIAIAAVWRAAYWAFRKRLGQLVLIPRYTTGTASITKYDGTNDSASRTVNFSGATLTQNMVGRFVRFGTGGLTWYKIVSISGNTVYLDSSVVDASNGASVFEIWKRFYYLKSEAEIVIDGFNWDRNMFLDFRSDTTLSYEGTNIGSEGNPVYMGDFGIDPYDDISYAEGSISIAGNSNIVLGVATSWLGNVNTGDILKINTKEYTIKRVESDTQLILYNYAAPKIDAGSTYTIRKNNPIGLQFYYSSDAFRVVDYTYLTKPYPLLNEDYDLFPMDFDYIKAVLDRAESILLKDIDKMDKYQQTLSLAELELQTLKRKKDVIRPRFMQFAPTIPRYMSGRS